MVLVPSRNSVLARNRPAKNNACAAGDQKTGCSRHCWLPTKNHMRQASNAVSVSLPPSDVDWNPKRTLKKCNLQCEETQYRSDGLGITDGVEKIAGRVGLQNLSCS